MNASHYLYAQRWMVRDTFRQAIYTGLFGVMLGISAVFIAVCLTIGVSGDQPIQHEDDKEFLPRGTTDPGRLRVLSGELTLMFGAYKLPLARDRRDAVYTIQLLLAGGVADSAGILLALLWSAGFVPAFLEPSAASVLLTKPIPRTALLIAKYLSVLVFVFFQATIFIGGTWLALGLKTGIWDMAYLWAIPLLLAHFAVFYSFSVLLAVHTRSTVASAIGSVAFWLMCWGMNFGRHMLVSLPEGQTHASAGLRWLADVGYWILPKPADLGMLLFNALEAHRYFVQPLDFDALIKGGFLMPDASIWSSLATTLVILLVAVHGLANTDY
ncbi:MAG: ABC transporter permease [Gemmataceae bacterium]